MSISRQLLALAALGILLCGPPAPCPSPPPMPELGQPTPQPTPPPGTPI